MVWGPLTGALVVFLAFYVWMAFGLGAVFAKVGAPPRSAWVPVRRYVVAARAAELPTNPVWIARLVAPLCWVTFAVIVLLRAADAVAGSAGLRALATLAFMIGAVASLVGWGIWIAGAHRLELRLVVQRRLVWLAAVLPPAWAAVIGFGGARQAVAGPVAGDSEPQPAAAEADDATRAIRRVVAAPPPEPEPVPDPEPEPVPDPEPELAPEPALENESQPQPA